MFQESFTLYKLIILYMLNLVDIPLTQTQITSFILEKGYTNYLTVRQAIDELKENDLLTLKQAANRTQLYITDEGRDTIRYFENRINEGIKEDIRQFFTDNKIDIKTSYSIRSDYYKLVSGEYEACLTAKEKDVELVTIKLSVPTKTMAEDVCGNWQEHSQEVYQTLTRLLF